MANNSSPSLGATAEPAPKRPSGTVLETLWHCAWDAFVLAILVQIFGSIVIGLVGGVWREMTPSLPPPLAAPIRLEAEAAPPSAPASVFGFHFPRQHRFEILFGLFLVSLLVARFRRHLPAVPQSNVAAKLGRLFGRVSEQWFDLIVVNAFTAFVGVMALQFAAQFTPTYWLWQVGGDLLRPALEPVLRVIGGSSSGGGLAGLVAWYQTNHFKFIFWLLYSAAICDDLGLPNYKALGRWLWRRYAGSSRAASQPSACAGREAAEKGEATGAQFASDQTGR